VTAWTGFQCIKEVTFSLSQKCLNTDLIVHWKPFKKSLKIPKGQSESVYRRRTDNTMAKRKSKIKWHEPHCYNSVYAGFWFIQGWLLWNICHEWPWIVPLVVNTSWSFPHLRLITVFVTKLTQQVPLVEQELLTLPEHLSLPCWKITWLVKIRRVWRYQRGKSESIYRRTDNTMAKRKSTKGQTTILICPFGIFKLFLS
jgi:hypothetical protein